MQRQGEGKVRHIDAAYLYVQNLAAEKTLNFRKKNGALRILQTCARDPQVLAKVVALMWTPGQSANRPEGSCPTPW